MARPYTEQQVLKKLDIPDFRHLTKEKVIAFATMVPKMNPEVAKKALEQFPNFASTSLDILKEYRSVIQEAMEDDRESMRSCYDMYNRVMDSLEKMLDNDDLTFEQKTYILDQMQEVAAAVADKDSEKSRNRLKLIGVIGGVAAAIVAALASSLGGNIALKESNNIDDDNITDLLERTDSMSKGNGKRSTGGLILDVILTFCTGGLWLIWILIRYLRNNS